METPNLVFKRPIFVERNHSNKEKGVMKYIFQIHHLHFFVETELNEIRRVRIGSMLGYDQLPIMTDIKEIHYGVLYTMLTLLEYNHLNFKNEQRLITKLLHYVRSHISNHKLHEESDIYVSDYFRITSNKQIGVLFKHDGTNVDADGYRIGRILRSMGTFNIALFSAMHKHTVDNGRRYSVDSFYPPLFEQNQQRLNRCYDTANAYRNKKSGKDASFKQRINMILKSLNNDDIQELINISLIPFISQCAALSDIKFLFKNIKSQSTQPQKACFAMSAPSDPTTVTVIVQKTTPQENKPMFGLTKQVNYIKVYSYMSAKEFTASVLGDDGYALVSISDLLECTNSTDRFLELAKSKAGKGDLIDMGNFGHTVKYAKLVIRHNHKTKGYSIGKEKVKFNDFDELCNFLADVEKLISLFCVNKEPKKEIPQKTEKQTNLCKRTMFDSALNEYLRSNVPIPYKKGIVYHPLNLKDFAMWYCGKKGGHDSQLLDIFNAPTVHLGNYRFFVDNGEARNSNQYLYSLRAMSTDTTSIDWITDVTVIFSFLFDNYVKSGHA